MLRAYLTCRPLEMLRNADGIRRGTVPDRLPVGLVCANGNGAVVGSTEPAGPILRADAADTIHGPPHALRVWLRSARNRDGQPVVTGRPGVQLRARRCPLERGHAVFPMRETPTVAAAAALGIRPRTVQKHLDRVFAKLGVNRPRRLLGPAG